MILSKLKEYYLAIGSLILVLSITFYAYYVSKTQDQERDAKLFEIRTEQAREQLERRMGHYIQILRGARGFFSASDTVTLHDFRRYMTALKVEENYPGIQGIGFAMMLSPEEVPRLEKRMQALAYPDFKVTPQTPRTEYSAVVFLEPADSRNLRAIGFDMFSEPVRREAMEAARDFNGPALTGKVTLVQEVNHDIQGGFLIYLPVYYGGEYPSDVEERRKKLKGFVFSPFRGQDLIKGTLRNEFNDMSISIFDGKKIQPENLIYSKDTVYQKLDASGRKLMRTSQVKIAGHTWTLEFKPTRNFSNDPGIDEHNLILLAGVIISLLIFFVVWSLQRFLQSNQLTELITSNATAGLFMLDNNGYCTFQNPAAQKILGYTLAELKQSPFYEIVHQGKKGAGLTFGQVHGEGEMVEDSFSPKEGGPIPVTCASSLVKQRGKVVGTMLEVRDITEQKKARQALQESEARFRTMADSAPVMIWMTDAHEQCTYVNKRWLDFTGSTLEQNLGTGWRQWISLDDITGLAKMHGLSRYRAKEYQMEYRLKRHDGVQRWMTSSGTPRFSPEGEFMGYIGSVLDITDRIEMQHQLQRNVETLNQIFMQVPAYVGLLRAQDQVYTLVNPKLSELYNHRPLVGQPVHAIWPKHEVQVLSRIMQNVIDTGETYEVKERKLVFEDEDGNPTEPRYINVVYQPIMDLHNKVESVVVFGVEVTEQVLSRQQLSEINEELNQKNEDLLRINNDLDNFVYTASHDLKSPLANLEGLTSALLENAASRQEVEEEDQFMLNMLASSITKLKNTIHDLTEITKVQKNLDAQTEMLLFADVLVEVEEDIRPLIQEANAQIQTDFKVRQLKYAKKNLRSILYNLVSNAMKYRDPSRQLKVCIDTWQEGECIVLRVSDNGLGIREDQLTKLFTMFRRFHSHVEGTGIGLYIIKRTIENNGGRIEVESEVGEGTTFTIYFKADVA